MPSELAYAAAYAAKALSDHAAAAANLEEIARVARGTAAYNYLLLSIGADGSGPPPRHSERSDGGPDGIR